MIRMTLARWLLIAAYMVRPPLKQPVSTISAGKKEAMRRQGLINVATGAEAAGHYFKAAVYRELYRRDLQIKDIAPSVSVLFGKKLNTYQVYDSLWGYNKSVRATKICLAVGLILDINGQPFIAKENERWHRDRRISKGPGRERSREVSPARRDPVGASSEQRSYHV